MPSAPRALLGDPEQDALGLLGLRLADPKDGEVASEARVSKRQLRPRGAGALPDDGHPATREDGFHEHRDVLVGADALAGVEQRQQVADEPDHLRHLALFEHVEGLALPVPEPVLAGDETAGVDEEDRSGLLRILGGVGDPKRDLVENGALADARRSDHGDRLLSRCVDQCRQIVDDRAPLVGPFELALSRERSEVHPDAAQGRGRGSGWLAVGAAGGLAFLLLLVGGQRELVEMAVLADEAGQGGGLGVDGEDFDPLLGVEPQGELTALVQPSELLADENGRVVLPAPPGGLGEDVQIEAGQPDVAPGLAEDQGGEHGGDRDRILGPVHGEQVGDLEPSRGCARAGGERTLPARVTSIDEVAHHELEVLAGLIEIVGVQLQRMVAEHPNGEEPVAVPPHV